ncbi:hypothetical protein M427DRAFT_35854 [Gonapodya prolifera JEL478]|uniref:ParB/Sulfiredoxin domain-containing protein n=1 Tax=Gonapodya prolifera (strain JEL478) TaxID=1344416 RepID=A0A139A3G2_GONPJ|nr:hypothetical protein M427DRAFT_35854 [Gonapodya prolifera JEL478]|eukprot:KXS11310.1 hypothetical protein M427DRAFT_35854 [Gonapodya prolifera JEL478]
MLVRTSIRKNSLLETTPFVLLELDNGCFAVVDGRHRLNALLELRVEGTIAIDGLDDLKMEILVVVLKADMPEQEQRLIRRNLNYIGKQKQELDHEDVIEMLPGAGSAAQLKKWIPMAQVAVNVPGLLDLVKADSSANLRKPIFTIQTLHADSKAYNLAKDYPQVAIGSN